jgi:hypothetical protein
MSVDFQRLAEVRARRSRRRRGVLVLVALGVVGLLVAAGQLTVSLLPERSLASLLPHGPPFVGPGAPPPTVEHVNGAVKVVEPKAGRIRVSSGFLGLTSVELVVTPETLIVVGDKEGGFGDIREGRRVNAAYETRPGPSLAKRVEVVVDAD